MALFSEYDRKQVEAAIAELEKKSATELVVAILPRSGDYRVARAVVAVCWGLAAGLGVVSLWPHQGALFSLLIQIPIGLGAYLLFGAAPLWRMLIRPEHAAVEVERRAFAVFSERGLHDTRDRTGMLILVSELERRVVILGDRTIHDKVGDSGWQAHVERVIAAIRAGQAARGLLEVIAELGRVHAELLPVGPDDTNELGNEILTK